MAYKVLSAGVSEEVYEQIEEERDGDDEPRSAAVRRIIRRGLDDSATDRPELRYAVIVALFAYVGGYFALGTAAAALVGGAFLLATTVYVLSPGDWAISGRLRDTE
jgi:hypothetical protein